MALTPGSKLGPYEIQSPLGAGGMGEVYRARDTRLDRAVAIKILPAHLSDNPEAKQRFDREDGLFRPSTIRISAPCTRPAPRKHFSIIVPRVPTYFGLLSFFIFIRVVFALLRHEAGDDADQTATSM